MTKNTTKAATFKIFEAARLTAGKYAGMCINRSEEREHEGKFLTYYSSSASKVSRDWYGIKASDLAAIGYECLGFWDIPAGLKAAALMVCRISDYCRYSRFSLDRSGAWMFHYDNPEGIEYSNGSAADVTGDRVEMDDDQNAREFVWALSKFERVQFWKKEGRIFMVVGCIDDGRLLLLNSGVNARFVNEEDDIWTVDPAAEIVEAVDASPAEPVDACWAKKAGNDAREGENARGGAEVRPEAETAPEAKETAKKPRRGDCDYTMKAAAMLETLESRVSEGESLPEHWRRVWKACGIKGVTVSSRRGGYTSSYTFKITMMPGDLLPFENCHEALEEQARERLARGVWDDEKGGYIDYFHMTGDEQRAEESRQARKYWEKVKAEGCGFSICHYWQIDRKNSPEFSESFWRRWELVGRSVARFNYDRSDAMTDYFDVGFYEDWEIRPEGKAAYRPAEWYLIDNLYNLAKARDEKAEAERKAKEEAEARKEREEREAHYYDLEERAHESVATWSEAFPHAAGVAPFVTVEWCEINAIHETGEEHAQEEGTPATRWSLDAFNMVTEDLDRYVKGCGWFGYFKLKYTVEFPDGTKWTDRIDLGDGVGGLVESARAIVKYNEDRKAGGDEFGGTIYGGSVEDWRERLEMLEAATDPDAVAMARGLLELGETA